MDVYPDRCFGGQFQRLTGGQFTTIDKVGSIIVGPGAVACVVTDDHREVVKLPPRRILNDLSDLALGESVSFLRVEKANLELHAQETIPAPPVEAPEFPGQADQLHNLPARYHYISPVQIEATENANSAGRPAADRTYDGSRLALVHAPIPCSPLQTAVVRDDDRAQSPRTKDSSRAEGGMAHAHLHELHPPAA